MGIDTLAFWKSFGAHPTDMGITSGARNVVTTLAALDGDFTSGAVFHIVFIDPSLEQRVAAVSLRAIESIVCFGMAVRAYPQKTRGTLEDGPLRC